MPARRTEGGGPKARYPDVREEVQSEAWELVVLGKVRQAKRVQMQEGRGCLQEEFLKHRRSSP